MRLVATYSHHGGVDVWHKREIYEWATDLFEVPNIKVGEVPTTVIRDHLKAQLETDGWAFNVRVDAESDLTVFARKEDLAFQLQTGNISRYAYDLLKLQHLYAKKEIESAVLAVPVKTAARMIGSNIAHIERIWNEINIFDRIITIPMMIISFE